MQPMISQLQRTRGLRLLLHLRQIHSLIGHCPTEFVELPSKGKFYPPVHPLHNAETIEIKFMTAKEEDILTDRSLLKKGIAVDRVLKTLIVDKKINLT